MTTLQSSSSRYSIERNSGTGRELTYPMNERMTSRVSVSPKLESGVGTPAERVPEREASQGPDHLLSEDDRVDRDDGSRGGLDAGTSGHRHGRSPPFLGDSLAGDAFSRSG